MNRICFLNSVKFWGGGEKLHFEYARILKTKGHDVQIFASKNSKLAEKAAASGLLGYCLNIGNLSFLNPIKLLSAVRYFRTHKIDTAVFSASQDLKFGGLAAKLAGVRRIVYLRGLALPVKGGLLNRLMFKYVLTHIVANSIETKKTILRDLHTSIPSEKVTVIYHGIEMGSDKGPTRKLEAVTEKAKGVVLGNAGRLTRQKGQKHLIEVARILKDRKIDFSLFIAGTGELRSDLEEAIVRSDLQDRVFLLGFVSQMEEFMNSIDVFLLTSEWEGFGYVLVEAMAKAKPVVAFNISSNPEIVGNGSSGYLVEFPDCEAFAERTAELISDPVRCTEFGANGKREVRERFEINEKVAEFESYLFSHAEDA